MIFLILHLYTQKLSALDALKKSLLRQAFSSQETFRHPPS